VKKVRLSLIIENRLEDQLMREIKILYSLHHRRIVKLHFDFKDSRYMYLGMEFAPGGSLFDKLNKAGHFSVERATRYFMETCEALDYLHNLPDKVIHRDVKPENILLDAEDQVKLADFGWANMIQADKRDTFCGTLDYLPPEMIMGTGHDESVDMWNMGVLLYELTTGQSPFGSNSKETTCKLILAVDLRFPSTLEPDVRDLISKLCRKKPSERLTVRSTLSHRLVAKYCGAPSSSLPVKAPVASTATGPVEKKVEELDAVEGRPSVVARKLRSEKERLGSEKDQLLVALKNIEVKLLNCSEDEAASDAEIRKTIARRADLEARCAEAAKTCDQRENELKELREKLRRKTDPSERRTGWNPFSRSERSSTR